MDWNKHEKEAESEKTANNEKEKYMELSTRNSLVESAIDEYRKQGGLDHLPGRGKPIEIQDGDVLTSILKNANYQPPWVELRKEIAADMKKLLDSPDSNRLDRVAGLEAINQKIRKYNRMVPNSLLQKGLVSSENLERAYDKWV